MFARVTLHVADLASSERFYATVLRTLGVRPVASDGVAVDWADFSIVAAEAPRAVTRGLHLAFCAASRDDVDAFWRAGRDAGYPDAGAPGPRPQYAPDYYGAFLRDPDGNSAEAVHDEPGRTPGRVDHLWLRVADVAASRDFYAGIAPHAGFALHADTPDRAQFVGAHGSCSVVAGDARSANVHLAFPASGTAGVDDLHAVDPDGHTVEVVPRA